MPKLKSHLVRGFFSLCSTLKRRPGSPSSFLLALLITPPWRSLEAPCVMLLDSLFPQLSVSRQLIFTVLNAKYVHPRPALLTDTFYKCNVITNVKNSCREITTTYLSAGVFYICNYITFV